MAVLRLSGGSIWVHSPVSLDDELAAALAEIGEVKHIVTPNFEHTKYAQQVGWALTDINKAVRALVLKCCTVYHQSSHSAICQQLLCRLRFQALQ